MADLLVNASSNTTGESFNLPSMDPAALDIEITGTATVEIHRRHPATKNWHVVKLNGSASYSNNARENVSIPAGVYRASVTSYTNGEVSVSLSN